MLQQIPLLASTLPMPSSWKDSLDRWLRRWEGLSYGQQRMFQTLALLVLLAVCAPPAYYLARPLLNRWRHHHALAQAAQFEQQGDYRNLVLSLHRAVQIMPADIATWRWVARTLDALGNSEALVAHENIVALAPNDTQARAALAAAALRLGSPETARVALQTLERDPAQRESYLRLAAELARADEDLPRYAALLASLSLLRADDEEVRFNLGVVQLALSSPAAPRSAHHTLLALLESRSIRVRATLELLRHAARRRDAELAGATMRTVLRRPTSPPGAPAAEDPWPAFLQELQRSAVDGGEADIARVALWLGTIRRAPEALAWIDRLPDATRTSAIVREITVELAARIGDLPRVEALLTSGAWGAVQAESIRAAVATRSAHLAQHAGAALTRWQEAVRYADQSPVTLRALTRLARLWQDDSAAEIAAKSMLRFRPQSPWANRELRDLYFSRGETVKLLAHYSAWLAVEPDRPAIVFGWVRTAAALQRVDEAMDRRTAMLAAAPERPALIDLARVLALWPRAPQEARDLFGSTARRTKGLPETTLVAALVMDDSASVAVLAKSPQDLLPEERLSLKLLTLQADKRRE